MSISIFRELLGTRVRLKYGINLKYPCVKSSVKFGVSENTWRKTESVVFVQLYIGSDPGS